MWMLAAQDASLYDQMVSPSEKAGMDLQRRKRVARRDAARGTYLCAALPFGAQETNHHPYTAQPQQRTHMILTNQQLFTNLPSLAQQ